MKTRRHRSIRKGSLALALALVTLSFAVRATLRGLTPPYRREITLYAGEARTTRTRVGKKLIAALNAAGLEARLLSFEDTDDALDALNTGSLDLALLPSCLPVGTRTHIRDAAPLYIEALHLLVKSELVGADNSLVMLRNRTVDLGPSDSATSQLAAAVLRFSGLEPTGEKPAFISSTLSPAELEEKIAHGDRAALPDAVFQIATLPSNVAGALIRKGSYTLVPLPFAAAFRLSGLLEDIGTDDTAQIQREDIHETEIPAFTYQTSPAEPPSPLPTLGTRLSLLANDGVPIATMEAVLDVLFNTSFARVSHPPLDVAHLSMPTRLPLHPGTVAYAARNQPFITDERVSILSNALSIIGALAGSGLFLWQWRRQRDQGRRENLMVDHMRGLAAIERRAAELEQQSTLPLEPLLELQRALLELKTKALEQFASGELTDPSILTTLIAPVNATRDHVADLILHIRENVEEEAAAEGRSAEAVWGETIAASEEADEKRNESS